MIERGSNNRPGNFEERYRLYLDESGDHVFKKLDEDSHRYLCLLGCWFKNPAYLEFHEKLENFKRKYLPVHPDEPIILHREDIINRRGSFGRLCNENEAVQSLTSNATDVCYRKTNTIAEEIWENAINVYH